MHDRGGIVALTFGVCAAIGTMLGLRFKVIILVPFIVLVMVGTAAVEVAPGENLWSIVGAMIVSVIALQIGYLIGVVAYASLGSVSARVHRQITTEKFGQAIRFES
jgi:hypothetical protein